MKKGALWTVHILWLLICLLGCQLHFIWSYDYSTIDYCIFAFILAGAAVVEWIIFKYIKISQKSKKRINTAFMIIDGCFAAGYVSIAFAIGNPDITYIIWDMVLPVAIMCMAAVARGWISNRKSDMCSQTGGT